MVVNKSPLSPGFVDFTYILGAFFVVTLWVFKLTYANFPKYLIANMVIDAIMCISLLVNDQVCSPME